MHPGGGAQLGVDGRSGGGGICDVNGERHRVHEQTIVAVRAGLADRAIVSRLPEAIGDVGAASAAARKQ